MNLFWIFEFFSFSKFLDFFWCFKTFNFLISKFFEFINFSKYFFRNFLLTSANVTSRASESWNSSKLTRKLFASGNARQICRLSFAVAWSIQCRGTNSLKFATSRGFFASLKFLRWIAIVMCLVWMWNILSRWIRRSLTENSFQLRFRRREGNFFNILEEKFNCLIFCRSIMSWVEFNIDTEVIEEIENFLSYKLQNCELQHFGIYEKIFKNSLSGLKIFWKTSKNLWKSSFFLQKLKFCEKAQNFVKKLKFFVKKLKILWKNSKYDEKALNL